MKHAIFQYYLSYDGIGKPDHWFADKELPDWAQYSVAYFKKYAAMHNVDYHFSDVRTIDTENHFEHMRVCYDEMFEQYDKVLYVDVDVMPKNMEANIFDIDVVDVAGWPEWEHPDLEVTPNWDGLYHLAQRWKYFDVPTIKPKTVKKNIRMINSGVILWSAQGRIKAREFNRPEEWFNYNNPALDQTLTKHTAGHSSLCLDQPYMNAMWNKFDFDVLELPIEWNRMPARDENRACNFAHYVGGYRERIPKIFEDIR